MKYFIFTKHSQIVCLINVHILVCQMWLQVMEGYMIQLRFWVFSYITTYVWKFIASSNFYKLFVKAEVYRWKVNICNYLWSIYGLSLWNHLFFSFLNLKIQNDTQIETKPIFIIFLNISSLKNFLFLFIM